MVVIGFKKKGFKGYFASFVPSGIPAFLIPLIFIIEFFTYLIRPFTLSIRLAANMIAGHTILKVIAGFIMGMGVFGFVPVLFISVLTGFEFFVACLQAYIFTMLTCIYLNEAVNVEH
jgi:F-type H+-transporting ATPase subunit a